ncbi:MAG: M15 family metallopeptidase, partial [Bacilli bacterium]|nr:M15 family metallopeptidase [Bacilli bacterium]
DDLYLLQKISIDMKNPQATTIELNKSSLTFTDKVLENKKNTDNSKEINKDISYFNNDYLERYLKYKKNNKNLSDEQIIKDVNMNLDLKQYEDIIKAKNLNTEKVLVNKYYYLEEDYVPDNLEKVSNQYALDGMKLVHVAKEAFEKMAKDAKKDGLNIVAMSCYRSYDYQIDLYNSYTKKDGKEAADTYSGRPGHSEHQTGLAVDVYNEEKDYTSFEKTEEFNWMQKHAHEYGFILRFPKDKEKETGYHYESWHYRYVGKKIAKYIKENNISFEEYHATILKDW